MNVLLRISCCLVIIVTGLISHSIGNVHGADGAVDVPQILVKGFNAYAAGGPVKAFEQWMKGGPNEGSKDVMSQANKLRRSEYGEYKGYEIVNITPIGESTKIVYAIIKYTKGPLFASFTVYRANEDWIISKLKINNNVKEVFPTVLFCKVEK